MSVLLIAELANCAQRERETQEMKVCALSGVKTHNLSSQLASDLHLDHMDHTATQIDQFFDILILLIVGERYRHLSDSLCCHSYSRVELYSGHSFSLNHCTAPYPALETIMLIRIQSGNEKCFKIYKVSQLIK